MIYLILSAYIDENDNFHKALKIGYAKDLENRLIAYNTHLPSYRLLKTREGDEILEKHLHSYFSKHRISSYEWFEYNDDIIEEFDKITLSTILPIETITYNPKVNKSSFNNCKNKKDPELIKAFQDLYLIFQTTNSDINKIIKEELEKIDLRLYNKKHIDNWKEFYNSFTIILKNKIEEMRKEQERFNSLSLTHLPSYITLPISNFDYDLISEDKFIEELKNLKKVYFDKESLLIDQFLNEFNQDKNFKRCMRLYCTFLDQYPFLFQIILKISDIPTTFHMYYELLGHSGIRAKSYEECSLRNEVEIKLQNPSVKEAILLNFQPGNKYSNKHIKEKLKEIYNQFEFNKSPKASDLEEYFLLKKVQFKEGDKRVDGLLIENIK